MSESAAADQQVLLLGMPVLTRKLTSGQTTGTVYWSAYVKADVDQTGTVRIETTHSGVSDSVGFSNAAWTWTTPRAISIDCEDLSAADGRRGTSWDEMQVKFKADSVGWTAYLAAVSVWEE